MTVVRPHPLQLESGVAIDKICGIYGIFDAKADECLYIGQSRDVHSRWKSHLKYLKSGKHKRRDFCEWYTMHDSNPESIVFKVLEECIPADQNLNALEIKWFEKYEPRFYGSVPSMGNTWVHSEETKQRIRESLTATLQVNKSPDIQLECRGCGKSFLTRRKLQVFCDMTCFRGHESGIITSIEKDVCKSYLSGLSLRRCESLYGVSYVTIRNILIRNGVERR